MALFKHKCACGVVYCYGGYPRKSSGCGRQCKFCTFACCENCSDSLLNIERHVPTISGSKDWGKLPLVEADAYEHQLLSHGACVDCIDRYNLAMADVAELRKVNALFAKAWRAGSLLRLAMLLGGDRDRSRMAVASLARDTLAGSP